MSEPYVVRVALLALGLLAQGVLASDVQARVIRVGHEAEALRSALDVAVDGDVLELTDGVWSGPVIVDKAVILRGRNAVIDGHGAGTVIRVTAPGTTVEGLAVRGSGADLGKPDACIYLAESATGSIVRGNRLRDCAFGIWVHETDGARIENNRITGRAHVRSADRGNGVHLFDASHLVVRGNHIDVARDGVYVSATDDSLIEGNVTRDLRYGIHYMYSHRNVIRGNRCLDSEVGIALMQSRELTVVGNTSSGNKRNGLLFRDVQYTTIRDNVLERNGYGMFFFSSTENVIERNRVALNDVGFKIWAGSLRNRVVDNVITGNRQQIFYVSADDQIWGEDGRGNLWGDYFGWDQDRDGIGDRPYRVDSFKAKLLYQFPAAALLLRSPALELLSHLADIMPVLRVPTIIDVAPLTRAPEAAR